VLAVWRPLPLPESLAPPREIRRPSFEQLLGPGGGKKLRDARGVGLEHDEETVA
jgi:hypothetical protein